MKVTRNMLLTITASLGVLIIVYGLARRFFGFGLGENLEKYLFDVIIIVALGCFMYNRKLAKDEKEAEAAAKEAERRAAEGPEPHPECTEDDISFNDDNLPHWERNKNMQDIRHTDD